MRNRTSSLLKTVTMIVAMIMTMGANAYEGAYDKTPVGVIDVRELPAGRWIATKMDGEYFEHSDGLFMRLFDYINANDLSMTVPVQGGLVQAEMRFYLGDSTASVAMETDAVRVVDEPARWVASFGARGAYTETNVNEARQQLTAWLDRQSEWRAEAEPYVVFWNGPFTLWFMKQFEIHVPVQRVSPLNG